MSREVGEQLFGTCARVDVWLLLEYNQPWGAKAFEESDLPGDVKAWLSHQLESIPNARLHFIRQRSALAMDDVMLYVAAAREADPALYKFYLGDYDDLPALDIPAILAGESVQPTPERLFLVCTNGRRDRCCALHGLPVYDAMRQALADGSGSVWQTTHTGGHRFAANLLCFPHGLCYGRLDVEDVPAVIESYQRGEVLPDRLRGRSCYDAPVQAAEYYLRKQTGSVSLADFRLVGVHSPAEGEFAVEFESAQGARHHVHVAAEPSEWVRYASCGDKTPEHTIQYRLSHLEVGT
jgi:hypothetical protein